MWPRNQAEKLKYGNAKHCLLSLDDDHQAHMHLRFQLWKVWRHSALKLFSRWIWNSQQNNLFHLFVVIDSFLTDCSHVRHVSLAHTSHLRMEVPASDVGTQPVCWIHTSLDHCSGYPVSASFPVGLIPCWLLHYFTVAAWLMLPCLHYNMCHCSPTVELQLTLRHLRAGTSPEGPVTGTFSGPK